MSTAINPEFRFWTARELAAQLRVCNMIVYRMVEAGDLEAIRVGRSLRIPDGAVQQLLKTGVRTSGGNPAVPALLSSLRGLIIGGKLRRGVPLSPRDIAVKINASVGDVSEALTALLQEGLVKADPNGCLIVPSKKGTQRTPP